ncbi:Electron transfer flavoprotein-ubiquinone oxidoreductase [Xylophilus ampelinus]|nr:Electron transfer flavoprotein-ubiquinone oxidoreductase [Xylophilus ampelinus]
MTQEEILSRFGAREGVDLDVVLIGGGPVGLTTAIHLKQRSAESGRQLSVVVLEKGSEPGANVLSGAIVDPIGLSELTPDYRRVVSSQCCERSRTTLEHRE